MALNQTWDLESLFPGGSASPEFEQFLQQINTDIEAFEKTVTEHEHNSSSESVEAWGDLFVQAQALISRIRQAGAFVSCLTSQNVNDQKAKLTKGRINQISASFASVMTRLEEQILKVPQGTKWESLLELEEIRPIRFAVQEMRRRSEQKMGSALESLAGDLAVDGYHAWGNFYNALVGRMKIPFRQDHETIQLSVGQAENKLSSSDRTVRQQVFKDYVDAWANEGELIASSLNHLAGYRLNLYRHRGWDSVIKEPLDINRMSEKTLDVMWNTINRNKSHFVAYLNRKAQLLGLEKLNWYDVSAPLASASSTISYDQGAAFIVENFRKFSPKMADFAQMAFEKSWIEAEDRSGKAPGGFCTNFPLNQESRIFMTYSGTPGNVATLAHELGHAYHSYVMRDLPQMARGYAMNVAETASTFAEMIVADASVKAAQTQEERIALLEDKVERSVTFYMNIHARYLFETRFYEARKKGLLSVQQLNELMESAQREAYQDALSGYHPYFWASKLHFYLTGTPFYNFPYTFGYLFSAGIYARALQEGAGYEDQYISLLRDTARMTVEELALRHLGVDLTQPDFWQSAIDLTAADVKEFLSLTEPASTVEK